MKRPLVIVLIAMAAAFVAACGAPAENKPANTNTNANTAKPVAAAPTKEALFEMDKKANEAWLKGDKAYFEANLSDKFVSFEQGMRMNKAELAGMIGSFKCDVKTWNLDDPQMSKINDDTYVLTYKGTFDGSCTSTDGAAMKLPSPTRAATIYVRDGDKWRGAFHSETLVIDPKNPPPAPPKSEAKKDAPKKDAETVAKEEANKPKPGPNTDALVKLHTAGWEAFKAKDAKTFGDMISANMALVDPLGGYLSGKDAVIKQWTETMKCEGITKVSVADGFASALSPTVELLTLKGTADGTCDGQKNGPLFQSAVYVKEGEAWKLAFMFESPAM
jgi:ketosteroid isomerase-like protein